MKDRLGFVVTLVLCAVLATIIVPLRTEHKTQAKLSPVTEILVAIPSQYPTRFGWNNEYSTTEALSKLEGLDGVYNYLHTSPVPSYSPLKYYAMFWAPHSVAHSIPEEAEQEVLLFNECSWGGQANCTARQAAEAAHRAIELHPEHKFTTPCDTSLTWLGLFRAEYLALYGDFPFSALCIHPYAFRQATVEDAVWATVSQIDAAIAKSHLWGIPGGRVWVAEFSYVTSDKRARALYLHLVRMAAEVRAEVTHLAMFCLTASGHEIWSFGMDTSGAIDWDTGEVALEGRWYLGMLDKIYLPVLFGT